MIKSRVDITEKATAIVIQMQKKYGELIFHQSGGCCDGSSPMLLMKEDLYLDESDVLLGHIATIPFYMNIDQYQYWKHTHLTVDIVKGRGSSFSVEIPLGIRFLVKSRLLTEEEDSYFENLENVY
ncbi:hypothetical protein ULMS_08290 [Patiriisocius marinistellae]|uniref:UDP-glucose 4-epimerase n=1 Tax=Patiriisocius marinistellae TaxID=2494560 RepID=A0A5J4FZZ8_9FLAO|nr:DUF779 domain-containing protein [Patiriisocius marinistellae]GEQ85321.1 hypothetical protein ULMS_08290 [Patiriisocius marinistellae]